MLLKSKSFLMALFFLLVMSACAARQPATPALTEPTATEATALPPTKHPTIETKATATPGISNPTTTPLPSTPAPTLALASLQMLDAQTGWAWSAERRLLRTTDGGKTWADRTPDGYQYTGNGFFLDPQTAWLPAYLQESNRFGLLYTGDGGDTWVQYPQGPASGLHFSDALNGWAVSGDYGAGNVYFSLSQTSDGGKTWAPIPLKPPVPEPDLPPGTIHLCNICNDALYYDPRRQIIIYGDMGSMQPGGSVQMEISFDLGNTWQKQSLPLPQDEVDALVAPDLPTFLTDQEGLLPIHLVKLGKDGSYVEQSMIFYATADGGKSWSLLPANPDMIAVFTPIQVVPSQDVFTICGKALCVSHDQARTWQTVSSNLDLSSSDTRSVSSLDFINSSTGWVLVTENDATQLYQTSDGGAHWSELSPLQVPAAPPTVSVDTSIPTPTTAPAPNGAYDA